MTLKMLKALKSLIIFLLNKKILEFEYIKSLISIVYCI